MKKILSHNEFLSNLILEKVESGELPFKLSDRLVELLKKVNHKIKDRLLNDNHNITSSKFTLVDYDDNDIDKFTYSNSPKIIEYITQKTLTDSHIKNVTTFFDYTEQNTDESIWKQNRTPIRIGRFIIKLYGENAGFSKEESTGNEVETFANLVIEVRQKEVIHKDEFKIVEGEDIIKYYNQDSYESDGKGSTLYGSCMKYEYCAPYLGFYIHNNIKVVVLMSEKEEDKIIGRAVLWNIDEIDGAEVERKFLDRIYAIKSQDMGKFKELARKNGWLYKSKQDMWDTTDIVDSKDGSVGRKILKVNNIKGYKAYPYMDTLKYFNLTDNFLTNSDTIEHNYVLEDPDGGYVDGDEQYVFNQYHNKLMNINDLVWCEFEGRSLAKEEVEHSKYLEIWASIEFAAENWVYSKIQQDWFPKDDNKIIYIETKDDYVTSYYADKNYIFCEYDHNYYDHDDCVPSEQWRCVPHEDCVRVITDSSIDFDEFDDENMMEIWDDVDNRYKDDGTYFTIHDPIRNKDWNFDNSLKNSQIVENIKKGVV